MATGFTLLPPSPLEIYGWTILAYVTLRVWCDSFKCLLDCKLVGQKDIHPILGGKACIGMNIVQYTGNDAINKPTNSLECGSLLGGYSKQELVDRKSSKTLPIKRAMSQFAYIEKFSLSFQICCF